ncbi:endonuclease [Candidatus Scalindua japonica]|uniref:Endonuclease n=1 Tax=Candidatus Scalindua japonica TaxID=1284222 RepID=A0A286TUZ9_9BACT|nr:HNH endonuclease [Candidatus Scalindua japonica]GAX59709.1 endonuclease [Candidatus Scalindua japonica]
MQSTIALESSVLVLNKFYAAVHVVNAKRAFAMLFKECAEVVSVDEGQYNSYDFSSWVDVSAFKEEYRLPDEDRYESIKTVSLEIRVPKIIRLVVYDKLPRANIKFNRKNIFARDKNRCQYCGRKFSTSELSLDHVIPKTQGGTSNWKNIVCACTNCNKHKGGRRPAEAGMKLICEPIKPKYCPIIQLKLGSNKYNSWKQFLSNAYWSVPLE